MATTFTVHGPFKIHTKQGKKSKNIETSCAEFWSGPGTSPVPHICRVLADVGC